MKVLAVMLGGAVGALLRYLVTLLCGNCSAIPKGIEFVTFYLSVRASQLVVHTRRTGRSLINVHNKNEHYTGKPAAKHEWHSRNLHRINNLLSTLNFFVMTNHIFSSQSHFLSKIFCRSAKNV